jgi:hypothetical protein
MTKYLQPNAENSTWTEDLTGMLPDNGGRRLSAERRRFVYTYVIPERRSGQDRRSGKDRRESIRLKPLSEMLGS